MARPDYLILGAQRCGTTSLARYLRQHPNVIAPPAETHYFTVRYHKGLQWYGNTLGKRHPGSVHGEKSADYLPTFEAMRRIKADAFIAEYTKFIVLLRDPVMRAWSAYHFKKARGDEKRSFSDAIKGKPDEWETFAFGADVSGYLYRGHYAEQLTRWFDAFPRDRFLILCAETFFEATESVYNEVLDFLGLPPFTPDFTVYGARSKGVIHWKTRQWLEDYYRPHNDALSVLLGWGVNWNDGYRKDDCSG
jgi:hypothetical protein